MNKLTRLTAEDRAEFVAYLDGELDEAAAQRIEAALANNPVARNDLEMLARTYDLLDALPRPAASQEFTERTMSIARMEEVRPDITQSVWFQRARHGALLAGWTGLLLACGLVGYAITNRWIPRPDDVLVDQLPVIERLDEYRQVDNFKFLERLYGSPQLLDEIDSNPKVPRE